MTRIRDGIATFLTVAFLIETVPDLCRLALSLTAPRTLSEGLGDVLVDWDNQDKGR